MVRVKSPVFRKPLLCEILLITCATKKNFYLSKLNLALGIQATIHDAARVCQRTTAQAAAVRVPGASGLALALVGPHQVVADRVLATRAGQAQIFVLDTLYVGITDVSGGAGTFFCVVDRFTLGVGATGIRLSAWIDTLSVAALFACFAVIITDTLNPATLNFRVALKSLWAGAQGAVIADTTFGSWRTVGLFARIGAFAGDAGLCVRAVGVHRAARSTGAETADVSLWAGGCAGALEAASPANTLFTARTLGGAGTGFYADVAFAAFGAGRTNSRFGAEANLKI